MTIAKTILSQIKTIDPRAMMAWGAKDLVALASGLQFRTGGLAKHKGLVRVNYDAGSDLYNVEFLKIRKGMPVVIHTDFGCYAEDLVNVIDITVC